LGIVMRLKKVSSSGTDRIPLMERIELSGTFMKWSLFMYTESIDTPV
jgi:hypothetical protein